MAQMVGVFRLGRDAEVRFTPSGDAVCNLSLAFNYGKKDGSGNRPSQWVDASLWGKMAESLSQYLTKGSQIYAVLDEPHIETYKKNDGQEGFKLACRVQQIELIGGRQDSGSRDDSKPKPEQNQQRQEAQNTPKSAADIDDDIPF